MLESVASAARLCVDRPVLIVFANLYGSSGLLLNLPDGQ